METDKVIEGYAKSIAKGASISLSGQIFGNILRTVFHILLANLLGSAVYGIYSIGFSFLYILSILSIMGLNMGVVRYIAIYEIGKDHRKLKGTIFFSLYFVSFFSIFLSLIIWQFTSFIGIVIFKKSNLYLALRMFLIILPFYSIMILVSFIFRGFQKLHFSVLIREVIQPFSAIFFLLFIYFIGAIGLNEALTVYLISNVIAVLFGLFILRGGILRKLQEIKSIYEAKELLKFSLPLLFVYFIILLLNRIDVLMLGYFRTSAEVGVYSAVFRITRLMLIFYVAINSIFGPIFAGLFHTKKMNELSYLFKMASRWVFTLTLPFVSFLFFFKEEILGIFGKDFITGGLALQILLFMYLILTFSGSLGNVLVMSGYQNMELLFAFLTLIGNIGLNILLIKPYGIVGAALATSISLLIFNGLKMFYVYVKIRIHPFNIDYLKILYSIIPIILLLVLLKGNQKCYTLFQTVIFAIFSLLIYFGVVYFKGTTIEDKRILKAFFLKFKHITNKEG